MSTLSCGEPVFENSIKDEFDSLLWRNFTFCHTTHEVDL